MTLHIFLNFIPRQDQPYHGILKSLRESPDTKIKQIDLPQHLFELTRHVEYSFRKYFRFIYYRKIYHFLHKALNQELKQADSDPVFIYTTDEGVWTEYIKQILQQHTYRDVKLINVQHGLHFLEKPSWPSTVLRSFINTCSRITVGFSIFGFGLGGSRCDLYLVYGEPEQKFLEAMNLKAVVATKLIKAQFLEKVQKAPQVREKIRVALFALQPVSKEAGFILNEVDFYHLLAPAAKQLNEQHGYSIVYRPHPGMDQSATTTTLNKAGLLQYGWVQDVSQTDIIDAIIESEIVLSHSSTVLLEALLVNRISIQLLENNDSKRLHLPIDFLCLSRNDTESQIDEIIASPTTQKESTDDLDITNWSDYLKNLNLHKQH